MARRLRIAAALSAILLSAACGGEGAPRAEPGPPVLRGQGHGYPWTGHQQPYLGRP